MKCSKCKQEKESFHKGSKTYCRDCFNEYVREWNKKNTEVLKERRKGYRAKRRKEHCEYIKKWRKNNPIKLTPEVIEKINKDHRRRYHILKNNVGFREVHNAATRKCQRRERLELSDIYCAKIIAARSKVSYKEILKYPELIKAHRESLKLKRLCKTLKTLETT